MKARKKILVWAAAIVLLFTAQTAFTQNKPSNHDIFLSADSYPNGQAVGSCKEFIRRVMADEGVTLGAGYRQCYLDIGYEISAEEVSEGDIIQTSNDAHPMDYYAGVHSAIAVENNGNNTFSVIHSNWCNPSTCNTVSRKTDYDPYSYASNNSSATQTITVHFYRLGTIVGFFSDGWHADGTSQAILDRYNAAKASGHDLGMAINNHPNKDQGQGTAFAHETYGNIMQDFYGASNNYDHPHTAIICNVAKNQAHLLKDGFWDKYMNNNGLQNLKQPKNEENNSNPTTQDFELGTLVWYGGNDVRIASSESNVSIAAFNPTHQITITSNPAGAAIWNAGKLEGTAPLILSLYQGYSYTMAAKKDGYQDKQFSFTVGSSDMTVNVELASVSGGVGPGAGSYSGNFPPSVPLTSPINTFPAMLYTADFTPCYPLEGAETGIKLHWITPQTNSTKIFWIGNVGWWRVDLRLKSLRFIDDGINPQWPEVKLTVTPHYGDRQTVGPFAIMSLGWQTYTVYAQMPSTGEHILELALTQETMDKKDHLVYFDQATIQSVGSPGAPEIPPANPSLTASAPAVPTTGTTVRFYVESAGDGYTSKGFLAWSSARSATTGGAVFTQTIADNCGSANHDAGNGGWKISRGLFGFNTASLPDNAIITQAVIGLWFSQRNGSSNNSYHIVAGSQASLASLVGDDYDNLGATSFANIMVGQAAFSGYTAFTLNTAGLAQISKVGDTKFGTRLGCDLNNQEPSTPFECGLRAFMVEYGSRMPYLEITYEIPDAPVLSLDADTLEFTADGSQTFNITNSGIGTLTWSLTDNASWLACSSASGSGNTTVTATVNATGLSAGTYTANISTTSNGGNDNVVVVLTIAAVSQSTTATFSVTTAGDGYTGKGFYSWSTSRNATSGGAVYGQTIADCFGAARHDQGNGGWSISRGLFGVNTSSIPDNATVVSATIGVWFSQRNGGSNDSWHIVAGSQASLSSLIGDDYDNVGSVSFANIMVSAATFGGYTEFALNASGLSQISKTGDTKFGARLGCDLNNQEPSTPFECGLRAFMVEYGSRQPYIRVTYTVPLGKEAAESNENAMIPTEFALSQNYPNPFNPETTIIFALPQASNVKLTVYDLLGKEVATVLDSWSEAGEQRVQFNASALPSGAYFYRLTAGSFNQTRKMMLLK